MLIKLSLNIKPIKVCILEKFKKYIPFCRKVSYNIINVLSKRKERFFVMSNLDELERLQKIERRWGSN